MALILENVKSAKEFLVKREIKKNNTYERVSDVPRELYNDIVNRSTKFQKVLELTENKPNYTYPFTLFVFGETKESVTLQDLKDLMKWLDVNSSKLPKQIQKYSKIQKDGTKPGGWEILNDDIRDINLIKNAEIKKNLNIMEGQKQTHVKNYEEFLFEYEILAAEPERQTEKPNKEPTVIPGSPPKIKPGKRPGPIPGKRPFIKPEPAKASAEDVIDRLNNIIETNE